MDRHDAWIWGLEKAQVFILTQRTLGNKGMLGEEEIEFSTIEYLFSQYYLVEILISSVILNKKINKYLPMLLVEIICGK